MLDLIAKIWPHAYIEMNDDEGYDRPLADRAKIDPNEVDLKFYKDKSVFDFFSGEKYNCERLQAINFHTEPNHFVLAWDEDPTHELEHIAESICFYLSLLGMIQLDKDDSSIEIPSMLKPILELVEEKKQTLACAS
ncbi:MAG TPA: hypothetical protein VKX17_23160 [Planctomycetota bacterium]|nr:hypothetical protein [Planctomycetota bacterium]